MQVHYRINEKTVSLILTDLAPHYHQAAQDTGYSLTDEGFVREMVPHRFDPEHLDRIVANSQKYVEPLFAQRAGLQPVLWDEALLTFLTLIEGQDIDWCLVGSGALAVRGLEIQPGDLDLCTSEADALRVQDLLIDYAIQPVQDITDWVGRWFGRAFLGAKLEWMGGVHASADSGQITDFGLVAQSRLETINWRGYAIRVPPLDLQLEVSLRRGLHDRADKIRQAMSRP